MNNLQQRLQSLLGPRTSEAALIAFVLLVVGSLIVPLPTFLLDLLLSLNLAISLVLLLVGLSSQGVRSLTALPSILLLTTLARLSLNIASTRLILLDADAGRLIEAFGDFVVRGNTLVGAVIFLILTIVNFMVISKGTERIAEVAARFSLDAMPGRQMAIDADLRAQAITLTQAQTARQQLQDESRLYGAMDGAMKFVKGDAIAGMIITAVNLLGGLLLGVTQHNLSLGEATRVYSLLTIGDGLVSQIPALLIATAAGLVITRVGNQKNHLADDISQQLLAHPQALAAASLIIALLALIPGLPLPPFLIIAAVLALMSWWAFHTKTTTPPDTTSHTPEPVWMQLFVPAESLTLHQKPLQRFWHSNSIKLKLNQGFTPPPLQVIAGEEGRWMLTLRHIPEAQGPWTEAMAEGDLEVISSALQQAIRHHLATALGPQEVKALLDDVRLEAPEDVEALVPRLLDLSQCTEVLQRLVKEGVPLLDMRAILSALVVAARDNKEPELLVEAVRSDMKRAMTWRFAGADRTLRAWQLHPEIEDMLQSALEPRPQKLPAFNLSHGLRREVLKAARAAWATEPEPVLLTSPILRPHVRALLGEVSPELVVLSYQELLDDVQIQNAGTISVRRER